jgi:hypothetical protein
VAEAPRASAFLTRHSWSFDDLPTWESEMVLDVSAVYGATPQWVNATDDDGARIQEAIKETCDPTSSWFGFVVFVPHGLYGLFRPIDLLGCASMIGAGSHSTALAPVYAGKGEWKAPGGGNNLPVLISTTSSHRKHQRQQQQQQQQRNVSAKANPNVMLIQDFDLYTQASRSPFLDLGAGANILLRDVGISLFCSITGGPGKWPPPLLPSEQRMGGGGGAYLSSPGGGDANDAATIARANAVAKGTNRQPMDPSTPLAFVTIRAVSGASKFFGLPLDGIFGNADTMSLILVSGSTSGRLDFYQASTEHSGHNPQSIIINSTDVHFHSWKYESSLSGDKAKTSNSSLVWIRNCSKISTFGGSGYYRTYLGAPMIVLEGGSDDVTLMGMEREWAFNEPKTGTQWLSDERRGVTLDGHLALLYYRDRA